MTSRLAGRAAVITGASSGIGAALAETLAARGVAVVVGARRLDRLTSLVSTIESAGGRALAVGCDVTREADVRVLVMRALTTFGRLDIVVANAGAGFYGTLDETTPEVMTGLMDVNFMGTFHAARAALPHFEQQRRGHLVIVSSIQGRRAIAFSSAYASTKFAQAGLAEALRAEFAGTEIHVTSVFPVSTATEFREAMRRDRGLTIEGHGPSQSSAAVAAAIVGAIERPRPEVYPYRLAKWLPVVSAVAPRLADRLMRRFGRRRAGGP